GVGRFSGLAQCKIGIARWRNSAGGRDRGGDGECVTHAEKHVPKRAGERAGRRAVHDYASRRKRKGRVGTHRREVRLYAEVGGAEETAGKLCVSISGEAHGERFSATRR